MSFNTGNLILKGPSMAKATVPTIKAIGIALLVVGAGLIYWGYQLSGSLGSQLTETISGSMPDEVMIRYIAGAVCAAIGAYLVIKK